MRAMTFGLLLAIQGPHPRFSGGRPTKSVPDIDQGGMERKSPPLAFFTERSLATYLAVSDRTIRNWIRRGELASYKLGAARRIDPADLDAFLAKRREEEAT